ncbi:MAG TPA: hypothetical protein PKH24_21380 [Sedimentisphaerales bacterium]|jgi:general secretion pathway protein D|nr:hypothetical protein [Sedimentisphaerales bacterium]HNU31815.1 hypothetical protein [Sedimentisphaerales bacterium]
MTQVEKARHPREMQILVAAGRASGTGTRQRDLVPTSIGKVAFRSLVGVGLLGLSLFLGCSSTTKTDTSIAMEQPRVANGAMVEGNDPATLEQMAAALEAADLPNPDVNAAPTPEAPTQNADPNQQIASPARISMREATDMTPALALPPESTKLIALPRLSRMEINEIADQLVLSLGSELGYGVAAATIADALPLPPTGVVGCRIVTRSGQGGTHVLQFGYRPFVSQPPQLWTLGVIVGEDSALSANPDLAQIEPKVTQTIASLNAMRADLTVRDLEAKLIQLSYVDAATAMSMLKGFGVTTLNQPGEVPPKIEFPKLPYVVNIEDPKKEYTGLVGTKEVSSSGAIKLSMAPGAASELMDNAIASPMTQLLVLYHPAHPEQFSEVRQVLDTYIDRPARQIFIEAMVLEISQQGLKELGVEWELNQAPLDITAGSLGVGASDTLRLFTPDSSKLNEIFDHPQFQWDWQATIRALVRTGKAEILSRPSVLTLDNRQSTIRVGQDIPIASSLEGLASSTNKVSFTFQYLPTGIVLNVRPRIAESGSEVSMLIDTIVSAKVVGEDLEMKSSDGTILASAPTVSARRVQTYGRIPNNTPLIIGGLVAREDILRQDKIPFLGDLPLIGFAFRSQSKDHMKREVIIVLTPHVLPERRDARRALPKDEDLFDSFGNELFRDSYRIRSEDVFDLTFLLQNRRIVIYRRLARQAVEKNFRLGMREPFRSFVRDDVPGEPILVSRMIYEVIKRLDVGSRVDTPRIIYFKGQQVGGYEVKFLDALLTEKTKKGLVDFGDQALAITFCYDRASLEEGHLGSEPIPEVRMVPCADREAWSKTLWELNQPTADGERRHTILIQDESDITRLRRALVLKRVAVLNGGIEEMRLKNFSVGKVLLMPELKRGQIHVIDADTAMFFFHTEHYYAAALAEIEEQLKELDKELRRPDIRVLLNSDVPKTVAAEEAK